MEDKWDHLHWHEVRKCDNLSEELFFRVERKSTNMENIYSRNFTFLTWLHALILLSKEREEKKGIWIACSVV